MYQQIKPVGNNGYTKLGFFLRLPQEWGNISHLFPQKKMEHG